MASTLETIATLAKAGFTKDEIVAMLGAETKKEAPVVTTQQEAEKQAKEEAKEPVVKPQEKSETDKLLEALGLKMDTLTQAVYGKNISSLGVATPKEESVDDILAKIINPNGQEVK